MLREHGQASLEFLIVVAAFLSALLVMVPVSQHAYAVAAFGMDVRNAEAFMLRLESASSSLAVLGDGSEETIRADPLGTWHLSFSGNFAVLEVESPTLGKTKRFEISMPVQLYPADMSIGSEQPLKFIKSRGMVSVVNG